MKNKLLLLSAAIILASCGSHRGNVKEKKPSSTTTPSATKQEKPSDNTRCPDYTGAQWVSNVSLATTPTRGLQNKHIALWASHGRYYNNSKGQWEWQRPYLFCTTEDLYTQTIVVPYLIPMLERAGATVFTPRERDWQTAEYIIDNDDANRYPSYLEVNVSKKWQDAHATGYAKPGAGIISGSTNPFTLGTTRMAKATRSKACEISFQPTFAEDGQYAVYVSYPTVEKSVTDAEYTVFHNGEQTVFHVNQRMGGGTWVYLGTFHFAAGCGMDNRVVLTNASQDNGYVTSDAVRFGGGMGTVSRAGSLSGLPRCLEGARYWAQFAGAPDSVYNGKADTDDYKDDINVRSLMTNWLAGGSCFVPGREGKNVPIELSLAVHSDAGYHDDMSTIFGSLSICTTNTNGGLLADGRSRDTSKQFATSLLNNLQKDLKTTYGRWAVRELYDRNYSETRCPQMPSAIIETLSHQSFPDMVMGQDPNVRFTIARSLYKTILRFLAKQHADSYTIAPLQPRNPQVTLQEGGNAHIKWLPTDDPSEPTAAPAGYIVYTALGNGDFDNGTLVKGTEMDLRLIPNVLYTFKISAVNKGGESFTSEAVSAVYNPGATKTVLVVNGFHRVSAPAVRDNAMEQGFDIASDPGVPYIKTIGYSGQQLCFDKTTAGRLGEGSLGYCGSELEGKIIAGNTFDYVRQHAKAIMAANKYNVVSASSHAVESGSVRLTGYHCVDLLLGLEKDAASQAVRYKTFSPVMQQLLRQYVDNRGNLLVSGAYLASDMTTDTERTFLRQVLHIDIDGNIYQTHSGTISGMGTTFNIYSDLNATHYAATKADILPAAEPAFCALTYDSGTSACVAYKGQSYRTFAMGFPFECITSEKKQASVMKGILNFLMR